MSTRSKKRLLLVAKPWKGGLAHYLFRAMQGRGDCEVTWLSTVPEGVAERLHYRLDRNSWRLRLVEKINGLGADLALFINFLPEFEQLHNAPGNLLWLTDDPRSVLPRTKAFSRIYLSDPGYLAEAQNLIAPHQQLAVLPFACDPEMHHAPVAETRRKGVCFLANHDRKRDLLLGELLASGRQVIVFGNHIGRSRLFWQHPLSFRPALDFSAQAQLYAGFSASLNIHASVVRGGTNMRTFECAACAIPQLVEWRPGIDSYFESEREILYFRNADELCAQYDRLLQDVSLQQRLADQARRRVLGEHTYRQRLALLLQER